MLSNRGEQLARIYERGDVLRRQRQRRFAGGAVALVLLVGGIAASVGRGGEPRRVITSDDGAAVEPRRNVPTTISTTTTSVPADVAAPPLTSTPPEAPPSAPPETSPPETGVTTTSLGCRNSTEPACGPFYYDWKLPNQPLMITITPSNSTPRVGEVVNFSIVLEDEDGAPISGLHTYTFDAEELDPVTAEDLDTGDFGGVAIHGDGVPPGYGAWDPPPPLRSEVTLSTTYEAPGARTVVYTATQTGLCGTEGDFQCPTVRAELVVNVVP